MASPTPPVARRGLVARIFTALFVTIGVVASIAALLFAGLAWVFDSGDAPANNARQAFVDYANGLDDVVDATAAIGASNLQQPFNVDATVTLDTGCTLDSLERSAKTIQARIAETDDDVQVHPVVVCGDISLQVSPIRVVAEERMLLLRDLLDLPTATGASVTFPPTGIRSVHRQ